MHPELSDSGLPAGLDLNMKKIKTSKKIKNINQTDLFDLLAQLERLKEIESELNMTSSLGLLELNTIVEKQVDWVDSGLLS
ncbi:MAG: hypothetical protein Q7T96_13510 [Methylobacter sp.]|nr:hypothetical protein [Methylobacter sp.]